MPTLNQTNLIIESELEFKSNDQPPTMSKETTTTHTKGEWYLQYYTDAYTNIVRCNNGKGHETLFIASTPQSVLPESRANARLMSAAPDLLESLQEIIAITDRDHIAWAKAKAAIEKATLNLDTLESKTTNNDTTEGN
jgi:hypothetical protein